MKKVTVIDMQPITPAIGGGRQRLLGLYHALGADIEAVYVGSYDWPGEPARDQQIFKGLREITIPLSDAHHEEAEKWRARMGGQVVIDCMFCEQVLLSPDYLAVARTHIEDADVVVFSHPWAYPALRQWLAPHQLIVYDSQNVESVLRAEILGEHPTANEVLKRVVQSEYAICRAADLILTCSHEDRLLFARLFDLDPAKLRVIPNGIFAFNVMPPEQNEREALKRKLGVPHSSLAVFLGSNYGPNNKAAQFIAETVAPANPDVCVALMGGACESVAGAVVSPNLRLLGTVDEATKLDWLRAADLALNPLAAGSGTSIKMFDFLACGTPTLTTRVGARGILRGGDEPFVVRELAEIPREVGRLLADRERADRIAEAGRKLVEEIYAWERISPDLGTLLHGALRAKCRGAPFFSVVIPTYERPDHLDRLMAKLGQQIEDDFEVIVIDQSRERWAGADVERPFHLTYVWTPVRGAVKARNCGGRLATGQIIAFTDDDCEPEPTWLANARPRFEKADVVGIEGAIRSENLDDPSWRPVTNIGFEGIGFMTANLMVRNASFQRLDGFDMAFDNPHFREDTDFGWRLQDLGEVPFAQDVEVFHPPHRREIERESHGARNVFFEKDALLLKKHPEKYLGLFYAEGHYSNTPGFWEHFDRGLRKYSVSIPAWIQDLHPAGQILAGDPW